MSDKAIYGGNPPISNQSDMTSTQGTWEDAVHWLREQPDQQELVRDCYFDDPLVAAARRFHASGEWQSVRCFLPSLRSGDAALDLGAGRGIASYALARDGWPVTALEPDPSDLVGAAAIRQLAVDTSTAITVVEEWGEKLPFKDASFTLIYARQVLHHANDLDQLCRELFRVLKPGGLFMACREHVISRTEDLDTFLRSHPLHDRYGGEHAYTLEHYLSTLNNAGFRLLHTLAPWESEINLFPQTLSDARNIMAKNVQFPFPCLIPMWVVKRWSRRLNTPGRLYSFVGRKP